MQPENPLDLAQAGSPSDGGSPPSFSRKQIPSLFFQFLSAVTTHNRLKAAAAHRQKGQI